MEDLKFEAVEQHDAGFEKALRQVRFFHEELNLNKVCVEAVVQNNMWISAANPEAEETQVLAQPDQSQVAIGQVP